MDTARYKDLSKEWPEATIKRTFVFAGEGDYQTGAYPQGPWQAADQALSEMGAEDGYYEYTVALAGKVNGTDCFIVEVAL